MENIKFEHSYLKFDKIENIMNVEKLMYAISVRDFVESRVD